MSALEAYFERLSFFSPMLDLYQSQILDRSQNPRFRGELEHFTHQAEGANLSCGDEISWQLLINDNKIITIKYQSRACTICTASADMLAEELENKPLSEVKNWTTEKVTELLGIPLSPVRLKCALLPLEALKSITPS